MESWLKNATIYHIFIDRFCDNKNSQNKPVFCGGSIRNIIKNLDYIINLGITAIWISPFYKTDKYHGYSITNFNEVDPRFGSLNDLKELIRLCKENYLHIIADIVPNHCSVNHQYFKDAIANENSKYHNWFCFTNWPHDYLSFLEHKDLPKLNLKNRETYEYMLNSIVNWASLGFDGFRIDHVIGIPDKFLENLNSKLKSLNPEIVLIGEAWGEGMKYKFLNTIGIRGKHKLWKKGFKQIFIQKSYEGLIDGVIDFGWRNLVLNNKEMMKYDKKMFNKILDSYNKLYHKDFYLVKFLDNHDLNRLMFECNNNEELFLKMLNLLYKQNQPIVIYYGTEEGSTHPHPIIHTIPFSDLQARKTIPFNQPTEYQSQILKMANKRLERK